MNKETSSNCVNYDTLNNIQGNNFIKIALGKRKEKEHFLYSAYTYISTSNNGSIIIRSIRLVTLFLFFFKFF